MKYKSRECYEKVLEELSEILVDELKNVNSVSLRTDNESAQYLAWEKVFGACGLGKEFVSQLCLLQISANSRM